MCFLRLSNSFFGGITLLTALAFGTASCQNAPVANVNTNTSTVNGNTQTTVKVEAPTIPTEGQVINTREPDKYRATLVLTAQTEGGQQAVAIPQLMADVARSGADRRVEFKLPSGEPIIYLDRSDKRYILAPNRKQYAELTPEATGFELQRLMTPGQLVSYLEKQRGYERVGEETFNGRMAEKYRHAATAKTDSSAGDVKSETFVYVDKETGLPLRADLHVEASGDVQNAPKGLRAQAEMRDIKTAVDASLFEIPSEWSKVPPEQVRQQIDAVGRAVAAIIGTLLNTVNQPTAAGGSTTTTTVTTTAASPTPTASATPH